MKLKSSWNKVQRLASNVLYLLKFIWKDARILILLNIIFLIFSGLLPVMLLNINRAVISFVEKNAFTLNPSLSYLIVLIAGMCSLRILEVLIGFINSASGLLNGEKIAAKMDVRIMDKAKKANMANYDNPDYRDLLYSKIRYGVNCRPSELFDNIFEFVRNIVTSSSLLISFLLTPGGWIKPVILIFVVLAVLPKFYFLSKESNLRFQQNESLARNRRRAAEVRNLLFNASILDEFKIYQASNYFIRQYEECNEELYNQEKKLMYRLHAYNRLASVVSVIISRIPYILLMWLAFIKTIILGDFVFLVGSVDEMINSLIAIVASFTELKTNAMYVDYLREFEQTDDSIITQCGNLAFPPKNGKHSIEFRSVSFRYRNMSTDILHNVSFRIEPVQTAALVGLNGCGKSTLIKLLLRLYIPDSGTIFVDGVDIQQYEIHSYYHAFGVVFQDFCKYSLSVSDNLWLGNIQQPFDLNRAQKAVEQCELTDVIDNLEKGYDTLLTKRFSGPSSDLSIGQWQKLSIARAYYRDSEIILLDEPSASLDVETEYKIFQSMESLKGEKTTIFVSHNLSSVTICDTIILINNGGISGTGTHQELLHTNPDYARLFKSQAGRYQESL